MSRSHCHIGHVFCISDLWLRIRYIEAIPNKEQVLCFHISGFAAVGFRISDYVDSYFGCAENTLARETQIQSPYRACFVSIWTLRQTSFPSMSISRQKIYDFICVSARLFVSLCTRNHENYT